MGTVLSAAVSGRWHQPQRPRHQHVQRLGRPARRVRQRGVDQERGDRGGVPGREVGACGREHGTDVWPEPGSHAPLSGSAGAGTLYLGADAVVLEYRVAIDGRPEQNTDTWTLAGGVLRRAGVIRQPARVVWYDAVMNRTA